MDQTIEQLKRFWQGMSSRQRTFSFVSIALTVALLAFFVRMMATPDYKPLLSGLEPADTASIGAELAAKNIPFLASADGHSISVPAEKIDEARLEVASHDAPHSGRMGFELFDKVSWGQTEFDEKVNYQRALEGELERTIGTMRDVRSARVHIVMASDSVFLDRERGAKASVMLRLRTTSLSRDDLSSISRLVSGAVDNLRASDVAIIDADSNQSLGPDSASGNLGDPVDQELTRRVVATLAPVVGADHIRASVNVDLEPGTSDESQEKYDPAVSVTLNHQVSEDQLGAGAGLSGVPGTASNVPAATKPAQTVTVSKDGGETSKTESSNFGVNKTVLRTLEPAGRVRRITTAVVVDDRLERHVEHGKVSEIHHKRTPEELKQIEDLTQAVVGLDTTRGDVLTVRNMAFEWPDPVEALPVPTLEKVRKGLTDYSFVIRDGAMILLFLLAYLLMLRPMQKRALGAGRQLLADIRSLEPAPMAAFAPEPDGSIAPGPQRALALKKHLVEFVKAEPENSTSAIRSWLREEAP